MSFFRVMRERKFCSWLARADGEETGKIMKLIMKQYEQSYPEEEMLFVTLPKNDFAERKRILEAMYKIHSK